MFATLTLSIDLFLLYLQSTKRKITFMCHQTDNNDNNGNTGNGNHLTVNPMQSNVIHSNPMESNLIHSIHMQPNSEHLANGNRNYSDEHLVLLHSQIGDDTFDMANPDITSQPLLETALWIPSSCWRIPASTDLFKSYFRHLLQGYSFILWKKTKKVKKLSSVGFEISKRNHQSFRLKCWPLIYELNWIELVYLVLYSFT